MCVGKLFEIIVILVSVVSNEAKINAYFTKVECENHLPEVLYNISCSLSTDSMGTKSLHADLMLAKDIHNLTMGHFFSIVRGKSTHNLTTFNLDICQALGSRHDHFLTRLISEEIRRVSNIPLECPLKKNFQYTLKEFNIKTDYIPAYTPTMNWRNDATFYVSLRKGMRFIVYGRVEQSYTRRGR